MNRRELLLSLAAGAIIVPTRKFFLPPRGGWPLSFHAHRIRWSRLKPGDRVHVYWDGGASADYELQIQQDTHFVNRQWTVLERLSAPPNTDAWPTDMSQWRTLVKMPDEFLVDAQNHLGQRNWGVVGERSPLVVAQYGGTELYSG